jgi:hypothetical protein
LVDDQRALIRVHAPQVGHGAMPVRDNGPGMTVYTVRTSDCCFVLALVFARVWRARGAGLRAQ